MRKLILSLLCMLQSLDLEQMCVHIFIHTFVYVYKIYTKYHVNEISAHYFPPTNSRSMAPVVTPYSYLSLQIFYYSANSSVSWFRQLKLHPVRLRIRWCMDFKRSSASNNQSINGPKHLCKKKKVFLETCVYQCCS